MRANPYMPWEARLATVPTVVRECRAEAAWVLPSRAVRRHRGADAAAGGLREPAASCGRRRTQRPRAIPNARIHVLDGEGHFAHRNDPALVAGIIREFVGT